jgi:hypothetical protein
MHSTKPRFYVTFLHPHFRGLARKGAKSRGFSPLQCRSVLFFRFPTREDYTYYTHTEKTLYPTLTPIIFNSIKALLNFVHIQRNTAGAPKPHSQVGPPEALIS